MGTKIVIAFESQGSRGAANTSQLSFADQVAVVIGGVGGIGEELVKALHQRGCKVVVASRSVGQLSGTTPAMESSDNQNRTTAAANRNSIVTIACDASQPRDVARLFQEVDMLHGAPHIVVNCAGIGRGSRSRIGIQPAMHLDEAEWQEVCDTNLRGMFLVARAAARLMIPCRRGQIVNISSARSARRGQPFAASYSATKMAALVMFQSLAAELAAHGVRAWSLLPDAVATKLIANTNLAKRGAMNPGHLGNLIADLLSLPFDAQVEEPLLAPFGSFIDSPTTGAAL